MSFPRWWARLPPSSPDDDDVHGLEHVVRFDCHVVHVLVPKCNDGANAMTVTCKGVVRRVLGAARTIGRVDHPDLPSSDHDDDDKAAR